MTESMCRDMMWAVWGLRAMAACGAIQVILLLFLLPQISYSRFTGEAAKRIHQLKHDLEEMYQ